MTNDINSPADSFYWIRCWVSGTRAASFAVNLRQTDEAFKGVRQDDASVSNSIHGGRVDFNFPHTSFAAPSALVLGYLDDLMTHSLPIVPTQLTGGLDGAHYHVQIGNGESVSHFSWWLNCPNQWQPLNTFWHQIVALSGE